MKRFFKKERPMHDFESTDTEPQDQNEFDPETRLNKLFETIAEIIIYGISIGFLFSVAYVVYLLITGQN